MLLSEFEAKFKFVKIENIVSNKNKIVQRLKSFDLQQFKLKLSKP